MKKFFIFVCMITLVVVLVGCKKPVVVDEGEIIEKDAREYHMLNLATGFETGLFEPYYAVSLEYWGWDGGQNINYVYDEEMLDAAWDMMRAANDDEYFEAWQRYQYRYNIVLPTLPLYSDLYHAFFNKNLKNYEVTSEWVWTDAVLYSTLEGDDTLTIGTTTEPGVNMFGTFWGNNASNNDVRRLAMGYDTVVYQKDKAAYALDENVVRELTTTTNTDGSKTYTIELFDDLKWSDGRTITAKDYVFALLLAINPKFAEAGGFTASTTGVVVGSKDYADPAKNADGLAELPGVDLLDEFKFSITIGAENFPYYYEFLYYNQEPNPLHVIAPGADVVQGTNGAKITGTFTKESLQATVDKDGKGYRYDLSVSCGPYKLYNFDKQSSTISLVKNPYYKGNYEGKKPTIDNIVIRHVQSNVLLSSLTTGEIDLITSLSGGANIEAGLAEVSKGSIAYTTFPRNGYGLIAFHCDKPAGPTSSQAVRQAIAYLINRDLFLSTYTKGFGVLPHGEYGLSQWMVGRATKDGVVYGINEDGEEVALNAYSYDPNKAVEVLEADGWIWGNAKATEKFDKSKGHTVRYKKLEDGTVQKLEIPWGNTDGNPVSDLIRTQLLPNAAAVGIAIKDQTMDFNTLLYTHYYGAEGDGYLAPEKDANGKWVIPEYEKRKAKDEE